MTRSYLILILLPGLASAASPIGYAQASGYYEQAANPMRYQPLNVLDGRANTSWCSESADMYAASLTFGFKSAAKIDEVRIYTGNGLDERTFEEFGRAKKLVIRSASDAQILHLSDRRGLQAIALRPALSSLELTLQIVDQYPAEDPEAPVCLTDVIFYSEGKPLNGSWLSSKLKYDSNQSPMLGTWFAGPEGAADKFLSFYFDGTYRFAYEPYDLDAKGLLFTGGYQISGTQLLLEIPGNGWIHLKVRQEMKESAPGDVQRTLMLEGNLPDAWPRSYRDRFQRLRSG
jgi:hypothetical protein